jgi:hypothetical protein
MAWRFPPAVPALAAFAVVALAAPAAAAPSAGAPFLGPWTGALEADEAHAHTYDNNALDQPCVEVTAPYVAVLSYQPASADVTFRVGGQEVPAEDGSARHTFVASYCTGFPLEVAAGSGEPLVTYQVDAERSSPLLAPLHPPS